MRNRLFEREAGRLPGDGFVFLGNSLTEGFDLQKYFPGWPVINRGIGGDHIDGLLMRLDTSVLALHPARLFLMIGINDIADGRDNEYLLPLYKKLIAEILDGTTSKIYLQSLLPTGPEIVQCPPEQITALNRELRKIGDGKRIIFVDLYPHFTKEHPWLDPGLTEDGLHLNEQGYALWAGILKRNISESAER